MNKKESKMKLGGFRLGFLIYLGVLGVLVAAALIYVNTLLVDFEASQPDNIAAGALEDIKKAQADGSLAELLTLPKVGNSKFEETDASVYLDEYIASLAGKELTVKPGGSSYSGKEVTYSLMADGTKVGNIHLASSNTVTKLIVFTMSDWKVTKIEPALTVTAYDYYIKVPEDFTVEINGITAGEDELDGAEGGTKAYRITGLISEPKIAIFDQDGNAAHYDIKNNNVTPVTYEYSLSLPEGFSLKVNGKDVSGTAADGQVEYKVIRAVKPEMTVSDAYGNEIAYSGEGDIALEKFDISIPENYKLYISGKEITCGILSENSTYQYIAELGVTLPKQASYTVYLLTAEPDIAVRDGDGNDIPFTRKGNTVTVNRQIGKFDMPTDIAAEVDVLAFAELWSKFMTQDVYGQYNGFDTVAAHLKKDSYLYNRAWEWATSIDITFTSGHWLGTPPFIDESVTNYVRYSENCFSVDIALTKVMHLDSGKRVDDKMNSTFYYVNEGNGWFVADIIEIVG